MLEKNNEIPLPNTPKTLAEALADPLYGQDWKKAWELELRRVRERKTYEILVNWLNMKGLITFKKPIKSKIAFRVTRRIDGTFKFRPRLVACGYSQQHGLDYEETFCPTAKWKSFCILMNIAAIKDYEIDGADVENAFLESDIDKEIYMTLCAEASETGKQEVVRLNKSLYGLKQAGELWYQKLNNIFIQAGYDRSIHDICVYTKINNNKRTYIIIFVDDIIFIGNDKQERDNIINYLSQNMKKLTVEDGVQRYIGIDISRKRYERKIELSQIPSINKYLNNNNILPQKR